MIVWTIGYEKQRIDRLIATLQAAGIRRIVDVRDVAWSHNPAYRKKSIGQALEKAGIGYTHLQALGNPKDGREAAKSGAEDAFRTIFRTHLAGEAGQAALARLKELADAERCCMMCLERDAARCHRSLICESLAQDGAEIRHLVEPDLFNRASR